MNSSDCVGHTIKVQRRRPREVSQRRWHLSCTLNLVSCTLYFDFTRHRGGQGTRCMAYSEACTCLLDWNRESLKGSGRSCALIVRFSWGRSVRPAEELGKFHKGTLKSFEHEIIGFAN